MRSWVFRNLARLAALRGRPLALPAPKAPLSETVERRPRVRELQPVRRRDKDER